MHPLCLSQNEYVRMTGPGTCVWEHFSTADTWLTVALLQRTVQTADSIGMDRDQQLNLQFMTQELTRMQDYEIKSKDVRERSVVCFFILFFVCKGFPESGSTLSSRWHEIKLCSHTQVCLCVCSKSALMMQNQLRNLCVRQRMCPFVHIHSFK